MTIYSDNDSRARSQDLTKVTSNSTIKSIGTLQTVQYFDQQLEDFHPTEQIVPEFEEDYKFYNFAFGLVDKRDEYFLEIPKSIGSYKILVRQQIDDGRSSSVLVRSVTSKACSRAELGLEGSIDGEAKFFTVKNSDQQRQLERYAS